MTLTEDGDSVVGAKMEFGVWFVVVMILSVMFGILFELKLIIYVFK